MSFLIKLLRNAVGCLFVLADLITRPKKRQRSEKEQLKIEAELKDLSLYQFFACPFCIKTRRALHRLNLPIMLKNVSKPEERAELETDGGRVQVPCLKISDNNDVVWMYESSDIIEYLEQRFP
jgi:glutaredoxin